MVDKCIRCGGAFVLAYGHWKLCPCTTESADFIASLKPKPQRDRIMEIYRERERFRFKQGQETE